MKVGITYKDKTTFYSYIPNKKIYYAFINGNGKYSITLYENVYNNFYRAVLPEEEVNVKLKSKLSPYLVSTYDVSFKKGDTVCKTADKICYKLKYKSSKIIAIQKYIRKNISYDHAFAEKVNKKIVKDYVPDPKRTLKTKKGVCYDKASLFAAMCRSQGIPCRIKTGYYNGEYHAWNEVYIKKKWYKVDVVIPISKNTFK